MRAAMNLALRLGCITAILAFGACEAEGSLGRWIGDAGPDALPSEATPDAPQDAAPDATLDAGQPPITEAEQLLCDERGGGPGCGYCLGDSCCHEILRCTQDATCDCWLDCTRDRSLAECTNECAAPTESWQSFSTCSDEHCRAACPLE